jgi:hypothetical protein
MARFQIKTSQLKSGPFLISVSDTKTNELVVELLSKIRTMGIQQAIQITNMRMKEK